MVEEGPDRWLLSIIIPAYNEAGRIHEGADRLLAAANDGAVDLATTEIIWVDDGSTDDTAAVATEAAGRFPHARVLIQGHNRGKGAAVRAGVSVARGQAIAFIDADCSIDPHHLADLMQALATAPVAVGSRTAGGRTIDYGHRLRTIGGRAFNRLVHAVTQVDLGDTQCGLKAFTAPAARLLFMATSISGFAFDVEVLAAARVVGLGITEVPVTWTEIAGSSIRPFADPLAMVRDLLRSRRSAHAPVIQLLSISDESPTAVASLVDEVAGVLVTWQGEQLIATSTALRSTGALPEGTEVRTEGTLRQLASAGALSLG